MDTRSAQGAMLVRRLSDLGRADIAAVGGKNASLGEMIGKLQGAGIKVPGGFATTATAYWQLLEDNRLKERIASALAELQDGERDLAAVLRPCPGTPTTIRPR